MVYSIKIDLFFQELVLNFANTEFPVDIEGYFSDFNSKLEEGMLQNLTSFQIIVFSDQIEQHENTLDLQHLLPETEIVFVGEDR